MLIRFSLALVMVYGALVPGVLHAQEPTLASHQSSAQSTAPHEPSTDPSAQHGYTVEGGVYKNAPGGPIQSPKVLHAVDSKFPRRHRISGICVLSLVVNTKGHPERITVLRSLRPDFDENAIKAVKKYRFAPAMLEGKPVPVEIDIEVNFQLFP